MSHSNQAHIRIKHTHVHEFKQKTKREEKLCIVHVIGRRDYVISVIATIANHTYNLHCNL